MEEAVEEEETEMPLINLGGEDRDWENEWEFDGWQVDDSLEAPGTRGSAAAAAGGGR